MLLLRPNLAPNALLNQRPHAVDALQRSRHGDFAELSLEALAQRLNDDVCLRFVHHLLHHLTAFADDLTAFVDRDQQFHHYVLDPYLRWRLVVSPLPQRLDDGAKVVLEDPRRKVRRGSARRDAAFVEDVAVGASHAAVTGAAGEDDELHRIVDGEEVCVALELGGAELEADVARGDGGEFVWGSLVLFLPRLVLRLGGEKARGPIVGLPPQRGDIEKTRVELALHEALHDVDVVRAVAKQTRVKRRDLADAPRLETDEHLHVVPHCCFQHALRGGFNRHAHVEHNSNTAVRWCACR